MTPGTEFQVSHKSYAINTVPGLSKEGNGLKFKSTLTFTVVNNCWMVIKVIYFIFIYVITEHLIMLSVINHEMFHRLRI